MRVISCRRKLLLGDTSWSDLESEHELQLKGGRSHTPSNWWGLLGRMGRGNWPAVLNHEAEIRANLHRVKVADHTEFPEIAVDAMRELTSFAGVGYGTATLLLTLARPDRLLSLNGASKKGLGELSRKSRSMLGKPESYGELLQWLYDQRWYAQPQPTDTDLMPIWEFRAALVDAFVYEPV